MNYKIKEKILFIEYLRVLAFSSVFIAHKFMFIFDKNEYITIELLINLFSYIKEKIEGGAWGVTLFFLISGYVISIAVKKKNTKEFIVGRLTRIYPLYISAYIIFLVINYCAYGVQLPNVIKIIQTITLLGDLFETPYALNGVEWTLRVEMYFYIFIALFSRISIFKNIYIKLLIYLLITIILLEKNYPSHLGWGHAYTSLYFPILLLGSSLYEVECYVNNKSKDRLMVITMYVTYIIISYLVFESLYFKINNNLPKFYLEALAVFYLAWCLKNHLKAKWIIYLSQFTFSVYLFHNFLFDFISEKIISNKACALTVFIIVCYTLMITIENRFKKGWDKK